MKPRNLVATVTLVSATMSLNLALGCRHCSNERLTKNPSGNGGGLFDGFPEKENELNTVRADSDVKCMRQHGWTIFSGLDLTKDGRPMWMNWCAVGGNGAGISLFCPPGGLETRDPPPTDESIRRRMFSTLQQPRQLFNLPAPEGPVLHPGGEGEFAEVLFDPKTSQKLVDCFFKKGTNHLNGQVTEYPLEISNQPVGSGNCNITDPSSFDLLDRDSVAVKAIWYLTKGVGNQATITSYTPAPLWDSENPAQAGGGGGQNVFLNLSQTSCPGGNADLLLSGQKFLITGKPIPLGCYYHETATVADLESALNSQLPERRKLPQRIDQSTKLYFVLLGFHVATREIRDWTWQTYWWSGRAFTAGPDDGVQKYPSPGEEYFGGGSPVVSGPTADPASPWLHYVMNATFGVPLESKNPTPITFNPYLELDFLGGDTSNCLSCHQFAMLDPKPTEAGFEAAQTTGLTSPANGLHPCTTEKPGEQLNGGFKTDCLWSLADSNVPGRHPRSAALLQILESELDQDR